MLKIRNLIFLLFGLLIISCKKSHLITETNL